MVGGVGGQPTDLLIITEGWPGFGESVLSMSGYGCGISPINPQGDPFDGINSFPGNGQVLIGQFSTAKGTSFQGTMLLQFISNGVTELSVVSFFHVPGPGALAMMGVAGADRDSATPQVATPEQPALRPPSAQASPIVELAVLGAIFCAQRAHASEWLTVAE